MRTIHFLTPHLNIQSGGYLASIAMAEIFSHHCRVVITTYKEQVAGTPFLDDILADVSAADAIFLIFWGHDLNDLLARLEGRNIVYHAHSSGYKFVLPQGIPIIAVSRHTLGYWGRHAPNTPLFLMPNLVDASDKPLSRHRDIDVLVQTRKSSSYLLEQLVPQLQGRCKVEVVSDWVEDLNALYDRTKVYLYDSSEFWIRQGITEGFGLPPLEAMARGCTVFSSLNDALAEYLDPEINCHQLRCFNTAYDRDRILSVLKSWEGPIDASDVLIPYSRARLLPRAGKVLEGINAFFDIRAGSAGDIATPRHRASDNQALCQAMIELFKRPLRKARTLLRKSMRATPGRTP
jgi:glycosyltransferase involved in cell wall biosynthesis